MNCERPGTKPHSFSFRGGEHESPMEAHNERPIGGTIQIYRGESANKWLLSWNDLAFEQKGMDVLKCRCCSRSLKRKIIYYSCNFFIDWKLWKLWLLETHSCIWLVRQVSETSSNKF